MGSTFWNNEGKMLLCSQSCSNLAKCFGGRTGQNIVQTAVSRSTVLWKLVQMQLNCVCRSCCKNFIAVHMSWKIVGIVPKRWVQLFPKKDRGSRGFCLGVPTQFVFHCLPLGFSLKQPSPLGIYCNSMQFPKLVLIIICFLIASLGVFVMIWHECSIVIHSVWVIEWCDLKHWIAGYSAVTFVGFWRYCYSGKSLFKYLW